MGKKHVVGVVSAISGILSFSTAQAVPTVSENHFQRRSRTENYLVPFQTPSPFCGCQTRRLPPVARAMREIRA